jgi:adenosyl cobinamide kinase/adenosyl cobinamide phosphate guanylyltransferase
MNVHHNTLWLTILCKFFLVNPTVDEEMMERLGVLQDARMLKQLAQAFLYPEKPVVTTDPTVYGRNYYGRASAPEQETEEEAEEVLQILEDAKALKQQAVVYAHPEAPVETTDPTACCRCYFNRASAPEQETEEEAEERERILAEANTLKKLAESYSHPERPVVTTDPTAYGRNYYGRASAPEQETEEDGEERDLIMEDMLALKKQATMFAHPEVGVKTIDPTAYGRNYYGRASAPEQETEEDAEEHDLIMEDMLALKQQATMFAHPEVGVKTIDPTAYGRNYYGRASAPEQETEEDAEERNLVMEDMLALKKQTTMFAHPEVGVKTTDPTAYGRNYYGRASAPEQETEENSEERDLIMEDMLALKKQAQAYLHPEVPVEATDPNCFARCYYDRASAPEQETEEFAEERACILEQSQALKQQAIMYAHPEVGVKTTDPNCFARCFFNRSSAPEQETEEFAEERLEILADVKALKEQATSFTHPELPVVTTDPCAYGRNYYGRASAPEQETEEFAEERLQILAEAMLLKQQAVAYAHPGVPVETTDPTAYARNYYHRASAPEQETEEDAAERELIMEELKVLKQLAVDFAHPELPVETTDPTACGRNYYDRPSAKRLHDFISSTSEDPFEPIKDPADLDECDLHYGVFDWEEDTYLDIRHQLESLGDSARSLAHEVPWGDKDKENEVLSRSPSSIMLFGGYEEADLVDRFSIDLRETV